MIDPLALALLHAKRAALGCEPAPTGVGNPAMAAHRAEAAWVAAGCPVAMRERIAELERERERDEARTAALREAAAVLRGLAREYIARHGGGGDYCAGVFDAASRIEALTTTTNRSDDAR